MSDDKESNKSMRTLWAQAANSLETATVLLVILCMLAGMAVVGAGGIGLVLFLARLGWRLGGVVFQ